MFHWSKYHQNIDQCYALFVHDKWPKINWFLVAMKIWKYVFMVTYLNCLPRVSTHSTILCSNQSKLWICYKFQMQNIYHHHHWLHFYWHAFELLLLHALIYEPKLTTNSFHVEWFSLFDSAVVIELTKTLKWKWQLLREKKRTIWECQANLLL